MLSTNVHIGLDYDQTMVNTVEVLNRYVNNELQIVSLYENIKDYYTRKNSIFSGEYKDKFLPFFFDKRYIAQIQPLPGILKKLDERTALGYKKSTITARGSKNVGELTINQIATLFGDRVSGVHFGDHFTEGHRKKSDIAKELGITHMIEDNYDDAYDVASNALIQTFILKDNNPWNKDLVNSGHSKLEIVSGREDINI